MAKVRQRWAGVLAMAGGVSMAMASCGGESADDTHGGAAKGAGGSNAGSGSGKSGSSGTAGHAANAGRSGAGGTSGTRGGASGSGGSKEGGGGSQEGGAGSHDGGGGTRAGGTGGTLVDNHGGGGTEGTPVNPPKLHACGNPSSWSANLELCDHGFVHRTNDAACPLPPHPGEGGVGGASGMGPGAPSSQWECQSDAECAANQYCVLQSGIHDYTETHCQPACATNDDCASGEVCVCNPTFVSAMNGEALTLGVCAPGGCETDADCTSGSLCVAALAPERFWTGCETDTLVVDQFQCQSKHDECSGPDDCDVVHTGEAGAGPTERMFCPHADGHRTCFVGGIHPECVW